MGYFPLEEDDEIAELQRVLGKSQKGLFGISVTTQQVNRHAQMNDLALDALQKYLGKHWSTFGPGFLENWQETVNILPSKVLDRKPLENIMWESGDDNLESSCELLTNHWENPAVAGRMLNRVFNSRYVERMSIFSLENGGVYFGALLASQHTNGKLVTLVAVFDDHAYH